MFFIKTEQQELVEDLVQIITVFSCKLQGKHANKARKLVKELIDDGGEEDDKNNSSHIRSQIINRIQNFFDMPILPDSLITGR